MKKAIWREIYKLNHRKSTWWSIAVMAVFMIVIGIMMGRSYGKLLVMSTFDAGQIIMLILVVIGSIMFTGEFQDNTILPLIYHAPNKTVVFFAKYLTLLIYNVILHIIAIVLTILFNISALICNPVSLTKIYQYHQSLMVNMLLTAIIDIILTTMVIGMICTIACLLKSSLVSISVNAIIVLVGGGFSANFMEVGGGFAKIMRWNPLNMTYLTPQYYNYASYHGVSMLSDNQLLVGTIIYLIVFCYIGWLVFKKRIF